MLLHTQQLSKRRHLCTTPSKDTIQATIQRCRRLSQDCSLHSGRKRGQRLFYGCGCLCSRLCEEEQKSQAQVEAMTTDRERCKQPGSSTSPVFAFEIHRCSLLRFTGVRFSSQSHVTNSLQESFRLIYRDQDLTT